MNPLRQFWHAADKLFDLPRRLRAVRDRRTDPPISAGVLTTSLFLGAVLRVPSFLQLQAETGRPGWQRLTGRSKPISDDAFGYGLERARLDDLVFSELRGEVASHTFATVIGSKREAIMDAVAKNVRAKAIEFGIEVVDVRIKRADLPREVQQSVFARMQAEREREAKRYRSEGDEEGNKLRSQTDKERTIVLAEADARSR